MTRIDQLLTAGQTFSFEFFPPKTDAEHLRLVDALVDLQPLNPSFVSVTYRGGRSSRARTVELVAGMLRTTRLTPMAHLTCADHTRLELAEILVELRKAGVENLMALGGDPLDPPPHPDGALRSDQGGALRSDQGGAPPGELAHADELVELARAVGGFSIGVAAHPAGHPDSPDLTTDRDWLAAKLARADFAVTQFFFDPSEWTHLVDDLAARGVEAPVVPGIMPITSLSSIGRMAKMGAAVPTALADRLEKAGDPESVRRAGIDAATELCAALLDAGAPRLHFYTLNRSSATREIYANLGVSPELTR
jgi:methylenetetrahydrofolate reductase (NADPH)